MLNDQPGSKVRVITLRVIGILCILWGLNYFISEIASWFVTMKISLDILGLPIAYYMVKGGYELLRLKPSGRRIAVVLMYILLIISLGIGLIGDVNNDLEVTFKMFTANITSENPWMYIGAMALIASMPIIVIVVLSQTKGKAVFDRSNL